uniref:Uncharacterized protein n=1 Tax=Rhizophora mucronata TaxID=61149 RepID=A0A2P2QSR7_RHIMU
MEVLSDVLYNILWKLDRNLGIILGKRVLMVWVSVTWGRRLLKNGQERKSRPFMRLLYQTQHQWLKIFGSISQLHFPGAGKTS